VTEKNRVIAIRILREQEIARTTQNNMIRNRFGERITIALTAECGQRDREIEAINATIAMLDQVTPDDA